VGAGSNRVERFELITMGRVGVDLYPQQIDVPLEHVTTFTRSLGGSATNVAVAAARLGVRAAVITKVGAEQFGVYVREALERFGVDARYVGVHPTLRTPIVFCELFPPDDFPLYFYRFPHAPDVDIRFEELDLGALTSADVFWVTGTGLSVEPSRTATLSALEHRAAQLAPGSKGITIIDLDYRPELWPDLAECRERTRWFPALVSNHVVDLVNRYPREDLPPALTGYVKDRTGYDYLHHAEVGSANAVFVGDEVTDRFCVLGSVADHIAKLRALAAAGVDQFNIYLMNGDEEAVLETYGREIIPVLRDLAPARA